MPFEGLRGINTMRLNPSRNLKRCRHNEQSEFLHNPLHHYYMTPGNIPMPGPRIPNPVGMRSSLGAAHRSWPMNYTSSFLRKCKSLQFAILLGLAVHSANILKGLATETRMIAAQNRLPGLPLLGPRIETANAAQCVVPGSSKSANFSFQRGGRNDGE